MVPTEMVEALCESAMKSGPGSIRSKYVHRLTPITRTGKATLEGIREVAKEVLAPHFHSGQKGIKVCLGRVTSVVFLSRLLTETLPVVRDPTDHS